MATSPLVVSIEARAHLSGGLAEAQAQVKAAMANMAEAQAQFGRTAEQGNQQAAAALKVYQVELASAQGAVRSLLASEEQETQVLRSSISSRMAASAELRVLEGNFMGSTRAAGAFLATLPGVGAALQVAFPVFGVLALVEILYRGVEAIVKWGSALDQLSEKDKAVHEQLMRNAEDELRHSETLVKATYDLAIARASTQIDKAQLRVELEAALVGIGEKRVAQLEAEKGRLEEISRQQKEIADQFATSSPMGVSPAMPAGLIDQTIKNRANAALQSRPQWRAERHAEDAGSHRGCAGGRQRSPGRAAHCSGWRHKSL